MKKCWRKALRGKLVFSLVLGVLIFATTHLGWALSYTFEALPDFSGAIQTFPNAINASGQIVGGATTSYVPLENHGFLLSGGIYTQIDNPNGVANTTFASGINASNEIVGWSHLSINPSGGGPLLGFLLSGGTFSPILVPGAASTGPSGINDSGKIVGAFYEPGAVSTDGFLDVANTFTTIDVPGAKNTLPFAINNLDQIVGSYGPVFGDESGFFFDGSQFFNLDISGVPRIEPTGINNIGEIVGSFSPGGFFGITDAHGFLFSGGSFFQVDFPGSIATFAEGINNAGDIVGAFTDAEEIVHGFLATPALPGEGIELPQISGSLSPVPEPATMLLLGSGLLSLVGLRRKFRK